MSTVTVEVVGNSSGGGGAAPQPQPAPTTPPSSQPTYQPTSQPSSTYQPPQASATSSQATANTANQPIVPDNSRMISDIRREMQQRGVVLVPGSNNMSQIINEYGEGLKNDANQRISEKYDERRTDLRHRYGAQYEDIDKRMEAERQAMIAQRGGNTANDPIALGLIDQKIEEKRDRLYQKVGTAQDEEEQALDEQEKGAKQRAEDELTQALKDLTDYFRNESEKGETNSSILGSLRAQRQELIEKRDKAEDAETATGYSRELAKVDAQIREIISPDSGKNTQRGYDPLLQGTQGMGRILSGLQGGNIGEAIMGAGQTGVTALGLSGGAAMKALGWVGVAAAGAKELTETAKDYEAMAGLAALRSPAEGYSGENAMGYLNTNMYGMRYEGVGYTDLNLDRAQFAAEAATRAKQRGSGDNFFDETIRQIGLEKSLALNAGSLGSAGKYDRYGTSSTDAASRLVYSLASLTNSGYNTGVSMTDFTRNQEYLNMQQNIMGSYMTRSDKPSYSAANNAVAMMASVSGITKDERLWSDYATINNAIHNPANDQMRALVYGAVADVMPETAGRMDLIDRALQNPKNDNKIMQKVLQTITEQYGGTDTQMGYYAVKSLFPNIAPERLDEYMKQLSDPGTAAGTIAKGGIPQGWNAAGDESAKVWTANSRSFITDYTGLLKDIEETLGQIAGKMTTTTTGPAVGSGPRSGNGKR